ncbi:MAG: hypothetical protein A2033_09780 [Bacteroidetes bacterium GWA2_31_9]|nr:MAG: hypothetical protein A2033_09780 [Bacteroidetes bacterium GWA2_31_9]
MSWSREELTATIELRSNEVFLKKSDGGGRSVNTTYQPVKATWEGDKLRVVCGNGKIMLFSDYRTFEEL